MNDLRIGGTVHKLKYNAVERTGFCIIIGDDLHHYMALPSFFRLPQLFPQLTIGSKVTFAPKVTDRGMRARNITVTHVVAEMPDGTPYERAI